MSTTDSASMGETGADLLLDAGAGEFGEVHPTFPLRVESRNGTAAGEVVEWMAGLGRRGAVELLRRCRALRFDGFGFDGETFGRMFSLLVESRSGYLGGNSPRTKVGDGIFTSTEYPADQEITLHCEATYLPSPPVVIGFVCEVAPVEGGATPLASTAAVLSALDPAIVDRAKQLGVRYVNNLHGGRGLGASWQSTYQSSERTDVEAHLREHGYDFEWTRRGGLRTEMKCDAVRRGVDDEGLWVSQADQWHPSNLPARTREVLLAAVEPEHLPHYASWGDGRPFEASELAAMRDALRAGLVSEPWQDGSVVLCDNLAVAHGREPFVGPRRILVSIGT